MELHDSTFVHAGVLHVGDRLIFFGARAWSSRGRGLRRHGDSAVILEHAMSCLLLLFSKHLEINCKLLLRTEGSHGLLRRRTGVTRRVLLDIVARTTRPTPQPTNQD